MGDARFRELVEQSFHALELTEKSSRRSTWASYMGGVVSAVFTIVTATLIIQLVDDPSEAKRNAERFEARVSSFSQNAEELRKAFVESAADQHNAVLLLTEARIDRAGKTRTRSLVDSGEVTTGLRVSSEKYKQTVNEITLLFDDATTLSHPELAGFRVFSDVLLQANDRMLACVNSQEQSIHAALTEAHCDISTGHDALNEGLARIQRCEDDISSYVHNTTRQLQLEAEVKDGLASDTRLIAGLKRLWTDVHAVSSRSSWNTPEQTLSRSCGSAVLLATHKPVDGFQSKDVSPRRLISKQSPPSLVAEAGSAKMVLSEEASKSDNPPQQYYTPPDNGVSAQNEIVYQGGESVVPSLARSSHHKGHGTVAQRSQNDDGQYIWANGEYRLQNPVGQQMSSLKSGTDDDPLSQ